MIAYNLDPMVNKILHKILYDKQITVQLIDI